MGWAQMEMTGENGSFGVLSPHHMGVSGSILRYLISWTGGWSRSGCEAWVERRWLGGTREELGARWDIPGSGLKSQQSSVLRHCLSFLAPRTLSFMALVRPVGNWASTLTPSSSGVWVLLFVRRAVDFSLAWGGEQKPRKRQGLGMRDHPEFL